jgi:2-polyprenyl-3-methyl-5-hydroxy-6-metoxy-1,4-benzoquinol methylase
MEKLKEEGNDILSTVDYWNLVLKDAKLPRVNHPKQYYITMNFIDEVLKLERKKTFMEIGAGSSGWLPYFAQKYGYRVSGLDYSEVGCKLARQNLTMLHIDHDEVLCQDLFDWHSDKKYDIIFSYGVIEHFENPQKVIRIFKEHLNTDGIIITLIPNLRGLMGTWSRCFVPDIYKIHKVISKEELIQFHLSNGFKDLKSDYAGTFSFTVIPWIRSNHFLFKENSIRRKVSLFIIAALNKVFSAIDRTLHLNLSSEYFSPYVISIMRKAED